MKGAKLAAVVVGSALGGVVITAIAVLAVLVVSVGGDDLFQDDIRRGE